jgi:hypothetical protein
MAVYVVIGAKGGTGREIVKRLIEKPASEVCDPEASSYTCALDTCLEQTSTTTISNENRYRKSGRWCEIRAPSLKALCQPTRVSRSLLAMQGDVCVCVCACVCTVLAFVCAWCLCVCCVCVIVCGGHYFFICNQRTRAHGSSLLHDIIRGRQSACRDISVSSMR